VLGKGKQFLLLLRHPPCYSYSQEVFVTTTRKQTQITYIRHQPSYKQLGTKTNRTLFIWGNRSGHHNTDITTRISQHGHHSTDITTRTSQHGHYNTDITTRTSQHGHHNTGITTRTSQHGHHSTDLTTRTSQHGTQNVKKTNRAKSLTALYENKNK